MLSVLYAILLITISYVISRKATEHVYLPACMQFLSTSVEKLTSWRIYEFWTSLEIATNCSLWASFRFQCKEVDTLVLDYTKYPVCLVYVRKGPRINSTTFETEKIEGKRPVLTIGRTRKREGQLAGLVIGRTMISEGYLPGCPLISVIGRNRKEKGRPPEPTIGRTLRPKGRPPVPTIGSTCSGGDLRTTHRYWEPH